MLGKSSFPWVPFTSPLMERKWQSLTQINLKKSQFRSLSLGFSPSTVTISPPEISLQNESTKNGRTGLHFPTENFEGTNFLQPLEAVIGKVAAKKLINTFKHVQTRKNYRTAGSWRWARTPEENEQHQEEERCVKCLPLSPICGRCCIADGCNVAMAITF